MSWLPRSDSSGFGKIREQMEEPKQAHVVAYVLVHVEQTRSSRGPRRVRR